MTEPRAHNLRLLLRAVPPRYQEPLQKLVSQEYGDIFGQEDSPLTQVMIHELPSVFYDRVLQALTQLPQVLRSRTLFDLILQQTVEQVDPLRLGLAANVVRCSPPRSGYPVRSLRDSGGKRMKAFSMISSSLQAAATFHAQRGGCEDAGRDGRTL